jgi:hypothetical protein
LTLFELCEPVIGLCRCGVQPCALVVFPGLDAVLPISLALFLASDILRDGFSHQAVRGALAGRSQASHRAMPMPKHPLLVHETRTSPPDAPSKPPRTSARCIHLVRQWPQCTPLMQAFGPAAHLLKAGACTDSRHRQQSHAWHSPCLE